MCLSTYHVIEPTRGSVVKNNLFADNHPEIYVSDGYSSQKVGINKWQICLAHQIRDCNYLIDLENNEFAIEMKELFQDSIKYKNENLEIKKNKKIEILHRLQEILKIKTPNDSEYNLRKRFDNLKDHLFLFLVLLSCGALSVPNVLILLKTRVKYIQYHLSTFPKEQNI